MDKLVFQTCQAITDEIAFWEKHLAEVEYRNNRKKAARKNYLPDEEEDTDPDEEDMPEYIAKIPLVKFTAPTPAFSHNIGVKIYAEILKVDFSIEDYLNAIREKITQLEIEFEEL